MNHNSFGTQESGNYGTYQRISMPGDDNNQENWERYEPQFTLAPDQSFSVTPTSVGTAGSQSSFFTGAGSQRCGDREGSASEGGSGGVTRNQARISGTPVTQYSSPHRQTLPSIHSLSPFPELDCTGKGSGVKPNGIGCASRSSKEDFEHGTAQPFSIQYPLSPGAVSGQDTTFRLPSFREIDKVAGLDSNGDRIWRTGDMRGVNVGSGLQPYSHHDAAVGGRGVYRD
ncbi:hypothetical protein BJ508DRAFT_312221 [Ascobolus immersus RN42]|uniref:Uncharacterized protein n=1 Tax=Ascobolus immersus RN42 TaxID=1160509 RepID=A0A3N4HRQ4_ASCIM|nr:hypothetical protein BJ508DRAFT_312221 [Ascobolus immersus RN42]